MLIQRIKISNYKTYLSLDLDLTVDDDRPIILIGGANGGGKTTLFEAISGALYGLKIENKEHFMELLNQGHTASEALFNSIQSVIDQTLTGITISAQALYYAKFVNAGRKPGTKGVPIDVLVEWIRRKRLNMEGKRERSVAFAMQRSIRDKGIMPSRFIDKSIDKFNNSKRLEDNIERFMEEYAEEQLQTIFNQLTA